MTNLVKNISILLIALILVVILATYLVPMYLNGHFWYATVALVANVGAGIYLSKVIQGI